MADITSTQFGAAEHCRADNWAAQYAKKLFEKEAQERDEAVSAEAQARDEAIRAAVADEAQARGSTDAYLDDRITGLSATLIGSIDGLESRLVGEIAARQAAITQEELERGFAISSAAAQEAQARDQAISYAVAQEAAQRDHAIKTAVDNAVSDIEAISGNVISQETVINVDTMTDASGTVISKASWWEAGNIGYYSGENSGTDTSHIRTKGYLDVSGYAGSRLVLMYPRTKNSNILIFKYGEDRNFIGRDYTAAQRCEIWLPENCRYIRMLYEFSPITEADYEEARLISFASLTDNYSDVKEEEWLWPSLSMFPTFGIVGDSYASGSTYGNGITNEYEQSWGQILARRLGTACINFSREGLTTKTWLTDDNGLAKLLREPPLHIYYLLLGINDSYYQSPALGTPADIGTNADTYYGSYSRIINNIKSHAPNAKIIIIGTSIYRTKGIEDRVTSYNKACENLAAYYQIPYIDQDRDPLFQNEYFYAQHSQGHPYTFLYSSMSLAYERLIRHCIYENKTYFANYEASDVGTQALPSAIDYSKTPVRTGMWANGLPVYTFAIPITALDTITKSNTATGTYYSPNEDVSVSVPILLYDMGKIRSYEHSAANNVILLDETIFFQNANSYDFESSATNAVKIGFRGRYRLTQPSSSTDPATHIYGTVTIATPASNIV